jgi:RHS repeat-associated protein
VRHVVWTLRGWAGKFLARSVVGVALVMIAGLVSGAGPAPALAAVVHRSHVQVPRPNVKLVPVPFRRAPDLDQAGRKFAATRTRMPAVAASTAVLAAPRGKSRDGARMAAAGTPAWVQAVAPAHGSYRGPSSVGVRVEPRSAAQRLGIRGVVWQVSGLASGSGGVRAGLSYAGFAQAYGGNFGQRLALVQLPACALSTPRLARCRTQAPVTSVNDAKTSTVSTVLPLSRASAVVLAATTTAGGEGGAAGTYGATSLNPSGSWSAGGSNGAFTYSYPVTVPGASSPLAPKVALSYNSGSVDGQTSATQAQADWAGDGWSTGDSFIEQSFTPCSDNPEGVTLPAADQTEDMCYAGKVLTLSLNGSTTALVYDSSSSKWRLQDDNGATVTQTAGSDRGQTPSNAGYWVITERDGTSYYFGLNELPGWASGNATTNSVDYEPVYSANSGDPCYNSDFTQAVCNMPYRWHLDYVTDVHGDAMSYYYHQDSNYYGEHNGASVVKYVRDSYLTEIDYGFRDGSAYSATSVPDKVTFGTDVRCFASSCPAITSSNSGTATSAYPDVPYDLNCAQGSSCTTYGPTFWSTVRLKTITTYQYNGSAFTPIDAYTLGESEPATGDGTSPTLWLGSISRTGQDTGGGGPATPVTLPSVTFGAQDLPNRVDTTNFPGLFRYRIDQVTSEMGAVTSVTYSTPYTCTASYVQGITTNTGAASNTKSCYPVWWTPPNYTAPIMDWFEKYAVTEVTTADQAGGGLTEYNDYQYSGGAAWHYDDNEVVKKKYRTYGQFRGYGTVTASTGDGSNDPRTQSVTAYYRGMSDDNNTTAVTLTDSQGGTHDDANQLAGSPLETTTYNGEGGPADHSTITSFWVSPATATRSRGSDGLPDLTANIVVPAETFTRQALTDGGSTSWRYTETDTTYDATVSDGNFGLPVYAYAHTVPADPAFDRCTATAYAKANTAANLVGLVASTETDSVKCSGFTEGSPSSAPSGLNTLGAPATVTRPDQVVSATQTFYDDTSFSTAFPQAAAPATGDVTMTRKAAGYDASGAAAWPSWQTTARATYDSYGRPVTAYDGNGNKTTTAYTVNAAGLTTGQQVTNPLGQQASTTVDPARGLTLTTTDANNVVATEQYDTLGRLTSVWLDNRPPATAAANYTYAYTVSSTSVSGVVAKTMNDQGGYATTVTVLDSLGRTRQTQAMTPQGGRLITESFYDSRGWTWKKYNRLWDPNNTPALVLADPPPPGPGQSVGDGVVPDYDKYVFNGLGQAVQDVSYANGNPVSTTTTVYNGDRTTVIPPTGGTVKSTVTDPGGRAKEVDEYTAAPTVHVPSNTFTGIWYVTPGSNTTAATSYGYDQHGDQSTVTDYGSHTWTSTYNLLGQVTAKSDPDTHGTTAMTYDGDGNLLQQTSADGTANGTVSFTYDALNRKTAQFAAPSSAQVAYASTSSPGNQMASWVYDNANGAITNAKFPLGHLTTETTYSGAGNGGTVVPYVIQQSNFNVFGESTGEKYTIPATTATAGLSGTYSFSHSWTVTKGLKFGDFYPATAAAGLPSESVSRSFLSSPLDLVKGLSGTVAAYAQNTTYDAYGDVLDEQIGEDNNLTDIVSSYDPHTLRLTSQLVNRGVATPSRVDGESYAYDLYGNVTSQTSTRLGSASVTETQCYQYDGLDQLTQAWTANDNCAAAPTSASHSMVADGISGGAYWTSWAYDITAGDARSGVLGELRQQVQHSLGSGSDTTTTNTFGGASAGPHALTSAATAGGSTSSSSFGYDAAGNMTSRTTPASGAQTLSWNAAGQLTQVAGGAGGTTSYLYAPDGSLLLQVNPGSTTVYLDGEQLTATTSGGTTTVTGARIIALPSGGDAVRTGGTTSYFFEVPDPHGTNGLYLDNTAQNPAWRQFTPYGAPRGTAQAWIDNRGFLNKPSDAATGLTYVGARAYDPLTAQFISPDPVLVPGDPLDLNAYGYAQGNPVGNSDPTGLHACDNDPCNGPPPPGTPGSTSYHAPSGSDNPVCPSSIPGCPGYVAPYVAISPHVIVQTSDPHFLSMHNLFRAYMADPAYKKLINGNITQEEWLWTLMCHTDGVGMCSPQFVASLAGVGPMTSSRNDQIFLLGAAATATGEKMIETTAEEVVSLYKAPRKGATQKLLQEGFKPEDFPGPDPSGYPDGQAYFGLGAPGRSAVYAKYAPYGPYDGTVVRVDIPVSDFQGFIAQGARVSNLDGERNIQVEIPNTLFDQLNNYPLVLDGGGEAAGGE